MIRLFDDSITRMHPVELSSHRVIELSLAHFRNHPALSLKPNGASVVITGPNGAGKTNILEAISLFGPGRGLRGAKLAELKNQRSDQGWAVSVQLGETQLGTGQHPSGGEKRLLRANGETLSAQSHLTRYLTLLWQTPQMDGLFTHGASDQRRFFDRLVTSFDAGHAARIARYEHYMRERNKLLTNSGLQVSGIWLQTIEHKMAESSVAIAAARLETLHHLQAAMTQIDPAFPQAEITLAGFAETALDRAEPALTTEEKLAARLAASRREDAATGRSAHGAHRMELHVTHGKKKMPAGYCSTGEQKALLLSLLLAQAQALANRQHRLPILLLDEVVAHLDASRRAALFGALEQLGVQAWLTGTDTTLFERFEGEQIAL